MTFLREKECHHMLFDDSAAAKALLSQMMAFRWRQLPSCFIAQFFSLSDIRERCECMRAKLFFEDAAPVMPPSRRLEFLPLLRMSEGERLLLYRFSASRGVMDLLCFASLHL